jgi:predicted nucleotidyltransferase
MTRDRMLPLLIEVPQENLRAYCRRNHIRWLALFGSALGEKFGSESDIDLLVEFEPEAQVGFLDLSRMQRELADMWGRPVDLVPRNGLKAVIRREILESAYTLYAD